VEKTKFCRRRLVASLSSRGSCIVLNQNCCPREILSSIINVMYERVRCVILFVSFYRACPQRDLSFRYNVSGPQECRTGFEQIGYMIASVQK
jgi:hypothetical protein